MTIGELSNDKFDTDFAFEVDREGDPEALSRRRSSCRHERFGNTYGPSESEVIRDLPEKLKRHRVDVVISGMAG